MNMKKYGLSSLLCWLIYIVVSPATCFATAKEEKKLWQTLLPDYTVVQYAGNIGKYSVGAGWDYCNKHWDTELLAGWVPKFYSGHNHYTLTLKQTYTPWNLTLPFQLNEDANLRIQPFTIGLYANAIFGGNDFWTREPHSVYGGDYYRFSTRLRFAITLGQRLHYSFPRSWQKVGKGIDFYYEFSMNDLSIVSAIPNKSLGIEEILSLGVGARWHF